MSVPASKKSRSAVRRRRSHDHTSAIQIAECPNCKAAIRQHHACKNCGHYKGREAINMNKSASKTLKRIQKKAAAKEHDHDHDHNQKKEKAPAAKVEAEKKETPKA